MFLVLMRMGMGGKSRLCITLPNLKDTFCEGFQIPLKNSPHSLILEEQGGMINMLRNFMYLRGSKLRGGRMGALIFSAAVAV